MQVLVASSSVPQAGLITRTLESEGVRAVAWEVGTETPDAGERGWDAVILDLRSAWPVRARFLPAGARIAVLRQGNEDLASFARERGSRLFFQEAEIPGLPEAVRRIAGQAREAAGSLPEILVRTELPMAVVHPLFGIEEANPAFCRLIGATPAEVSGLDLASLFGAEEASDLAGLFLDLLSGERETEWREVPACLPGRRRGSVTAGFFPACREDAERSRILVTLKDGKRGQLARERLDEERRKVAILQSANLALNGTLDPGNTIKVLVSLLQAHADVDAVAVFLLDRGSMKLRLAGTAGFFGETPRSVELAPGEGLAGKAVLGQGPVCIPDLDSPGETGCDRIPIGREGFRSACAAPLFSMNRVMGVVEIFRREKPEDAELWGEMLESLARQASVALHRAFLLEELERANLELNLAYDSTIEGWSRALDLKCREPEGHTRKVTEMTLLLARRLGVSENDLQPIRRGAILHDIGKMGIPDAILTKPGPLSEDEWKVMRLHPAYALQMLQPVTFLRDALAIPYSHHEHWDGQGYPVGLKGDQIPLAARIFAVVDVWNSLLSDQPYRKAWKPDRAREYIRENSGRLFDPEITCTFLELLDEHPEEG
jgi:PAS domain-containing protein